MSKRLNKADRIKADQLARELIEMSKRLNKADKQKADQLARELIEAANARYAGRKMKKGLCDIYTPPENLPKIVSDQVLGILEVIANVLVERGVV